MSLFEPPNFSCSLSLNIWSLLPLLINLSYKYLNFKYYLLESEYPELLNSLGNHSIR